MPTKARAKKPMAKPRTKRGPPPWKHQVETKFNVSTDAACFGIRDIKFHAAPGPQTDLLNEGKMGVFATGSDGTYRFKVTTKVLTPEERRSVANRAHMGFLTTSGKVIVDSGTETSKAFTMPIGYATCTVFAMSDEARKKNRRLPNYVVRVRWVTKQHRFQGSYDDYPEIYQLDDE